MLTEQRFDIILKLLEERKSTPLPLVFLVSLEANH